MKYRLVILLFIASYISSCKKEEPVLPCDCLVRGMDRDKFTGSWNGYSASRSFYELQLECPGNAQLIYTEVDAYKYYHTRIGSYTANNYSQVCP